MLRKITFTLSLLTTASISQAAIQVSQVPLFLSQSAPPLNMLVMGRDHTLYAPAYDNASDLDGDGLIDVGYKGHLPKDKGGLDYFGYFDSYKCYIYSNNVFTPHSTTPNKTCTGSYWSGDYLNYLTTSRMDAIRKVLYGGYRSTDTTASDNNASKTILERAYIRQDAHTWGSEYTSQAIDGYNIKDYTEFDPPRSNRRIHFASTNTSLTGAPLLRVRTDRSDRIWDWVAAEVTQASGTSTKDFNVRVEVCKEGLLEDNCTQYGGKNYKPTGLLHDFGENDDMYFGLLTGSYTNNLQGGVLRKAVSSFRDELDLATGRFKNIDGIVKTLNTLRIDDPNNSGNYQDCTTGNSLKNGSCRNWGNPLGEMMFEALRYLSGANAPTQNYNYTGDNDKGLSLPKASWSDPYRTGGVGLECSRPFMTVISDVNPSYDSALPGNSFGENAPATTNALSGMNVSSLGQTIWNTDVGTGSKQINIGEAGTATSDFAPTAKSASSFGNIRGLPDEPTKQGTYYSASVAYYANTHPMTSKGSQPVKTYAVALSSPLPQIRMPVGSGEITLVPFGKVVTGNPDATMQITGFFVDSMFNMPGQPVDMSINDGQPQAIFRVVFDDAAQGADYDMDAVVEYKVRVTDDGRLEVILQLLYANAGFESHMGYTLAGAGNADGIYLEVSGGGSRFSKYKLDTPRGRAPGACNNINSNTCKPDLIRDNTPTTARYFTPGSGTTTPLKNPLWYAAKWGGFGNFDNTPNSKPVDGQWDSKEAGTPDNYFLVTNAANLRSQLTKAFNDILQRNNSVTSPVVQGSTTEDGTYIYRTDFKADGWTGDVFKEKPVIQADGSSILEPIWRASEKLPSKGNRNIRFAPTSGKGALSEFSWNNLKDREFAGSNLQDVLNKDNNGTTDGRGEARVKYILETCTTSECSDMRERKDRLGDIINSAPVLVEGAQYLPYRAETLDGTTGSYRAFQQSAKNRKGIIYVGANDGMLHAFNSATGVEEFAFIPTAVISNLNKLTDPQYGIDTGEENSTLHQYFVDGSPVVADVYFDNQWRTVLLGSLGAGGRSVFALDVTDPDNPELLWEFSHADDPAMGVSIPQPTIARLHSGQWAALIPNGYNSSAGPTLFALDIKTGEQIAKLSTPVDPDATDAGNGLSNIRTADMNGDGIVDYVYGGDLQGNVWRFDLYNVASGNFNKCTNNCSGISSQYRVAFGNKPLYVAKDADGTRLPITAAPTLLRHPTSIGHLVVVGTGRYLGFEDKNTPFKQESLYGIWDRQTSGLAANSTKELSRTNLQSQSMSAETMQINGESRAVRLITEKRVQWYKPDAADTSDASVNHWGWYLDLSSKTGERMTNNMQIYGEGLIFSTITPDEDPCSAGLSGFTYAINPATGGRTPYNVFDFSGDGLINHLDSLNGDVVSGFENPAGGFTIHDGFLYSPDGKRIGVDHGSLAKGRQSWHLVPPEE